MIAAAHGDRERAGRGRDALEPEERGDSAGRAAEEVEAPVVADELREAGHGPVRRGEEVGVAPERAEVGERVEDPSPAGEPADGS